MTRVACHTCEFCWNRSNECRVNIAGISRSIAGNVAEKSRAYRGISRAAHNCRFCSVLPRCHIWCCLLLQTTSTLTFSTVFRSNCRVQSWNCEKSVKLQRRSDSPGIFVKNELELTQTTIIHEVFSANAHNGHETTRFGMLWYDLIKINAKLHHLWRFEDVFEWFRVRAANSSRKS